MLIPEPVYWVLIGVLVYMFVYVGQKLFEANNKLRSKSVLHGNKIEQFMPFMKDYPYDPNNFKFLGKPIDGISFNDDEVVLMEFKTGQSHLSTKQRHIRDLINAGKVSFKEVRL